MDFNEIKEPITRQFGEMVQHNLFCVDVEKDKLWETYLGSFPEGSNPVFRERTEHDCSCCRHFVKTMGGVVAVVDGEVRSIWDAQIDNPNYRKVAQALSALVKSKAITKPFLHYERDIGTDKSFEDVDGLAVTWRHFNVTLPSRRNQGTDFFCQKDQIGPKIGEAVAQHDVLFRSLIEFSVETIDTVLELMANKSLYRGDEYKANLQTFWKLKKEFDKLPEAKHDTFVWEKVEALPVAVAKIRNTAIGTLLIDLSEGMDLEAAVRRWETVMAPANYKRPTALVTKAMVEKAKATVADLGLDSALERRYATLRDINVSDIIFADRDARKVMSGSAFDNIPVKASMPKNLDKVEEIGIEAFVSEVVPRAESIEVMFENRHAGNLVSLVAPAHASSKPLFKWDNGFSWSYNGEMADSIKERVKRAGGNVTGDLCCRLAWYNHDDLDFHMEEPRSSMARVGEHIFFAHKQSRVTGGQLDVDMNAGHGATREPVENIFYGDRKRMTEGDYKLYVHQYSKRESTNTGFEAEVDWLRTVYRFVYEKPVRQGGHVTVAILRYSRAKGIEIVSSLPSTQASKTIWGLPTQDFHRVTSIMLSPNYWNGRGVGNKHYMFMIDGCQNDGSARGFFNEFLRDELAPHRKVLEILGGKSKIEPSADQLSGLGFSSTQKNELLARVRGHFTRTVKVVF